MSRLFRVLLSELAYDVAKTIWLWARDAEEARQQAEQRFPLWAVVNVEAA